MAVQGSNILTLRVAGGDLSVWTQIGVNRSIETAASDFDTRLGIKKENDDGSELPFAYPEDAASILIGTDKFLTGYVDAVEPSISPNERSVTISGRSKTKDIIDCSNIGEAGKPLQFKDKSIAYIAQALCDPYSVNVVTEVSLRDPIPFFAPEIDESPFQAIERLAREASVLVTDNADGELVLTRVGVLDGPSFALPGNILSGSARYDGSQRFTEYVCKGQRAGDDNNYGRAAAASVGGCLDPYVIRRRVLVLRAETAMTAAACERRAIWEAVTRAGRSARINLTVRGSRDENGDIYEVNRLCKVQAPALYADGVFLSVGVSFSIDANGPLTTFWFAPPGGYTPEAPRARQAARKARITAGTAWDTIEGDD